MSYKNKNVKVKSNDVNKPKEGFFKRFFGKEINFFSSLGDKSRKLISNEPNFIIFLIMTFTLSIMFEKTGLSRTLPFVLIIPFLIGTFYGRRKATMLHTVIASIILGTVSGDAALTATVIIVGTICTFSGLYLSKYLEHAKSYGILGKALKFIFAGIMCILSFTIYAYYFGVPTQYLKAKDAIENTEVASERAVYHGITFNASNKCYEALYTEIADDFSYENKYLVAYDTQTGSLVYPEENIQEESIEEENIEDITE
ncbi:MAG: hypothetical protein MJ246_03890 [Clostridia bacterium]|nr:hypothetical protein [Clostridia bacterium]